MTDEHRPPRLIIKEYRHNPADRTVWIKVEGFYSMDLGIDNGETLHVFRDQDIDRFVDDLSTLRHENAALREKLKEYKEYFSLQKTLQENENDRLDPRDPRELRR